MSAIQETHITKHSSSDTVGWWYHKEVDVNGQDNSTNSNEVIQIWACQSNQSIQYAALLSKLLSIYPLALVDKTHFLSLNMKLNTRQMIASTIPAVANIMKMTVRETCTSSITTIGLPSYGSPPIFIITHKIYRIAGKFGGELNLAIFHTYIYIYGDPLPNRQI